MSPARLASVRPSVATSLKADGTPGRTCTFYSHTPALHDTLERQGFSFLLEAITCVFSKKGGIAKPVLQLVTQHVGVGAAAVQVRRLPELIYASCQS